MIAYWFKCFALSHIFYSGAYYYYLTEQNKTYSETMIDVYKYVTSIGLPVKNYQFGTLIFRLQ